MKILDMLTDTDIKRVVKEPVDLEGRITKKKLDLDTAQKIFGFFNKSYLIELIKSVFEGKEEDSLNKYRMISDLGTDPKIFLSDTLKETYPSFEIF